MWDKIILFCPWRWCATDPIRVTTFRVPRERGRFGGVIVIMLLRRDAGQTGPSKTGPGKQMLQGGGGKRRYYYNYFLEDIPVNGNQ